MTANQIAFQANKIKEQEAAIRAKEADTKARLADIAEQEQALRKSEHIAEYGTIKTDKDQSILGGQKVWKDMSQVAKNMFDSGTSFFKVVRPTK